MSYTLKTKGKFKYIEEGEGQPIIVLHGLMGALSNFDGVVSYFSQNGYKVLIPELPLYTLPLIKTNVRNLSKFVDKFINLLELDNPILLGNSLGGHIALLFTQHHIKNVRAMILTGSSGLYENSMGDTYPKRGDYEFIKKKVQEVFYDKKVGSKELVDEIYELVNNRIKALKTLSIAKSAIRHNMAEILPSLNIPVCLIWGKQDSVTPPEVAHDFNRLLPDSDLFWVDKCGHAPMMEHPDLFNKLVMAWLKQRNL
ncbi:MAG: alpha/beta hydrolase [Flavobacteriaceae bacterium]|nr:alpha/beta hydrolase [Flavobacteriaceae bacterium]